MVDPLVGEAEALFFALLQIQDLAISHLLLEGDSSLVVDCLQRLPYPSVVVP